VVSRCANPACFSTFRYLHAGKLFRFDARYAPGDSAVGKARPSSELFWLCEDCIKSLTVVWDPADGARVVAREPRPLRIAS
jgi:hypothetical protein